MGQSKWRSFKQFVGKRTTIITLACLLFVFGVFFAPRLQLSAYWLLGVVITLPLFRHIKAVFILLFLVASFMMGNLRGCIALAKEAPLKQFVDQTITLRAVAAEDSYYDANKRITFLVRSQEILEPSRVTVSAPLKITTYTVTSAAKGDQMTIKGKLRSGFGSTAGAIYFADVQTTGRGYRATSDAVRNEFNAGLQNALPEPDASFASGLLIGQRTGITEHWQDVLRAAGLTHIIAVSGYNLTILVRFSKRLMKKRSRYQVLLVSALLVAGFLMITGFSPSILRATIVVILMQLAWFYGREMKPMVLISVAAAVSIWIEPFQLWRSVGWYLSFAAFFGVIVLAPALTPKRFLKKENALVSLVIESVAAQVMTLPIIAFTFGQVSLSGILANVIVVPLVPLGMLLSFTSGIAGWLAPMFGGWIAVPAHLLLSFMLKTADFVSRLPGSRIELYFSSRQLLITYAIILLLAYTLWFGRRELALKTQNMLK